jgi:hypothetical protein
MAPTIGMMERLIAVQIPAPTAGPAQFVINIINENNPHNTIQLTINAHLTLCLLKYLMILIGYFVATSQYAHPCFFQVLSRGTAAGPGRDIVAPSPPSPSRPSCSRGRVVQHREHVRAASQDFAAGPASLLMDFTNPSLSVPGGGGSAAAGAAGTASDEPFLEFASCVVLSQRW